MRGHVTHGHPWRCSTKHGPPTHICGLRLSTCNPHWEYHRRISVACERHRPNMCLKPEELCATALPHSVPCNKSVSSSVSIAVKMVRKSCKFSSTILIVGCLCSAFILTRYTMSICGSGRMIISTSSTAL